MHTTSTTFVIEANPAIPPRLARLSELALNLWFGWFPPAQRMFSRLDPELWERLGRNPRLLLRCVSQQRLEQTAQDTEFLALYDSVMAAYDRDQQMPARRYVGPAFAPDDLIAYFCAEYGLHQSFPNYSGGLGILAGDHCKTASDLGLPFVAVGLLYRQGYFSQLIDHDGRQIAVYEDAGLEDLPVVAARDARGEPVVVGVPLPGREVRVQVWQARAGRVPIYLLDTNVDGNPSADREITHKLYGGDRELRIQQELVLGLGGVRALRALGLAPTVWHMNEGHAAFLVLERVREQVAAGLDFASALECVAASNVFTTHTAVSAGHDMFRRDLILKYCAGLAQHFGLDADNFMAIGQTDASDTDFNMTQLAIVGSRYQNGVSRIHGRISSEICADSWPEIAPEENPIGYVTNGVHVPTFLAEAWVELFDRHLGPSWRDRLCDGEFFEALARVPDQEFHGVSRSIKVAMLHTLRRRLRHQHLRNQLSEAHVERLLRFVDPERPDYLTVGFARRLATYKRATLLFNDLDWLKEIMLDDQRPVIFIFAGKAHPADEPGQALMRRIHEIANQPPFVGRILLVENYDLGLSKQLVAGVDVWLNNPTYPLEASGTSGMKAAMNGTLNLSVLDGWWAEGFDGQNGWAITPSSYENQELRDREDARSLYEILQDRVVPLYYERAGGAWSQGWLDRCKRSIASIIPRFNMDRVLQDYSQGLYHPAASQGRRLSGDGGGAARALAAWKKRVREAWAGVGLRALELSGLRVNYGDSVRLRVGVRLNGLAPQDLRVELIGEPTPSTDWRAPPLLSSYRTDLEPDRLSHSFEPLQPGEHGEHVYELLYTPTGCGRYRCHIRVVPHHELLSHPYEPGLMKWL